MKTVFDLSKLNGNLQSINNFSNCITNVEEATEDAVTVDVSLMLISADNKFIIRNSEGHIATTREVTPEDSLQGYFLLCSHVKRLLQPYLKPQYVPKLLSNSMMIPVRIHHHEEERKMEVIFHFIVEKNLFQEALVGDIIPHSEIDANAITNTGRCNIIYLNSLMKQEESK